MCVCVVGLHVNIKMDYYTIFMDIIIIYNIIYTSFDVEIVFSFCLEWTDPQI